MSVEDPNETAFLQRLARIGQGMKGDPFNPFEGNPTNEEKNEAARQYIEIKQAQEERVRREQDLASHADKQAHDQRVEEAKLRLEAAKLEAAAATEQRRLDLEFERLNIQKAEVIVRAIEAAARNPEAGSLLTVAREMSRKLLGGEPLPALQLEDQEQEEK